MSLAIKNAKELSTDTTTYLIYGQPGVGKTSAIKYLPGRTLVVDIDKSSSVLAGEENIDIVEVDTHNIWDEWLNVVSEIVTDKTILDKYDNLVIDNVSELFRSTLSNLGRIGKNNRVPSMADYQRVDFTILDSLRALSQLPIRLIFTAWEKSDLWEGENGQSFNRAFPDLRNSIMNNFLGLCDVVGRLMVYAKDDEKVRGFVLQPDNSITAKNRLDDRSGCLIEELVVKDDE